MYFFFFRFLKKCCDMRKSVIGNNTKIYISSNIRVDLKQAKIVTSSFPLLKSFLLFSSETHTGQAGQPENWEVATCKIAPFHCSSPCCLNWGLTVSQAGGWVGVSDQLCFISIVRIL